MESINKLSPGCWYLQHVRKYVWILLDAFGGYSLEFLGFEYFLIFLNTFGYCLEIFSLICLFWGDTLRFGCFLILWDTPKTATFFWIPGRVILDTIGMHICICSICICYSHSSCSKSSAPHSAFASARLMALRRLVAGRALDFEEELCMHMHKCITRESRIQAIHAQWLRE